MSELSHDLKVGDTVRVIKTKREMFLEDEYIGECEFYTVSIIIERCNNFVKLAKDAGTLGAWIKMDWVEKVEDSNKSPSLYEINKPFGELDRETQEVLVIAAMVDKSLF